MVEGAVPYVGDLLIQVALLVDVQLRVPPPVLLMDKDAYEGRRSHELWFDRHTMQGGPVRSLFG